MSETGLSPLVLLMTVVGYFGVLLMIARVTSTNADTQTFFNAKRQSPWYLVAFGMIGASLSGVTFVSVPGWVESNQFSYMQMVFGYLLGYLVIATVLMPMYYRMNLTSIYTYLEKRFGLVSYKTGSLFFLMSRLIQASFRLFLVALVLHNFVMKPYGIPFWVTVALTIILIWIYTYRGGIKTIVWTDTLQTACMLIAVVATIFTIGDFLDLSLAGLVTTVKESSYSQIFFWEGGWSDPKNFIKQFLSGALIAIAMTGLDQDMMQKNLTCRNLGDAQKNMFWFSFSLIFINLLFLGLGALLYLYAVQSGVVIPERSDLLYPTLALEHLPPTIGILFVLGLVAAAYSSADSALTSLTTAFCIDMLDFDKSSMSEQQKKKVRLSVHVGFSVLLLIVILIFYRINNSAVIDAIFRIATYTYGPLLGLYAFGFMTKSAVRDRWVPVVCFLAPVLTYVINENSEAWLGGYKFGYELLLVNGLVTFVGLLILSKKTLVQG